MTQSDDRRSSIDPWHSLEFVFLALTVVSVLIVFSFYFDAGVFGKFGFGEELATDYSPLTLIQPSTESEISYVYANGQRVASISNDGIEYYHSDYLGSSRVVTDSSGAKTSSLDSYPFGSTLSEFGEITKYKFTGKELDATGLQYFGARYYSSDIGRFTQVDPLGPGYAYAVNNPLKFVDPDGNKAFDTKVKNLLLYPARKTAYKIASQVATGDPTEINWDNVYRTMFTNKNSGYSGVFNAERFDKMPPDLLAIYFNLEKNTLPLATYKPTSLTKYQDVPLYSIAEFVGLRSFNSPVVWKTETLKNILKMKQGDIIESQIRPGFGFANPDIDLGHYTESIGKDENGPYVSVFDVWNFGEGYNEIWDVKGANKIKTFLMDFVGEPIGFYDRFYLDENQIRTELKRRSEE